VLWPLGDTPVVLGKRSILLESGQLESGQTDYENPELINEISFAAVESAPAE
jgi:hypothetical protein